MPRLKLWRRNCPKFFNELPPPKGKSIKNGTEFARVINGTKISRNEEMGSYDVTALYPSVPIKPTMDFLLEWLIENDMVPEVARALVEMTWVCMKQNNFQFRGKWYHQTDGTCIGNSVSSFVAEVFMCRFEMKLEKNPLFPRIYWRFVDDIFAVQNARKFEVVKKLFEDTMGSIKKDAVRFTVDRQSENKLPFLNVMVENVNGTLEVDVYRKPTSTKRLITSDSYHDVKHKMAAYHSMAHFMVNLPLSEPKVKSETQKIVEIGEVNGFCETNVMDIINKHQQKKQLEEFSTFYGSGKTDEEKKRTFKADLCKTRHRNGP